MFIISMTGSFQLILVSRVQLVKICEDSRTSFMTSAAFQSGHFLCTNGVKVQILLGSERLHLEYRVKNC